MQARVRLFLLLPVLPCGNSGNCSRNIPHFGGHAGGSARAVEKYRQSRLGVRQDAGRTLETAASTCDLKGQSTVAHPMHEIDAITSPRENDL